MALRGLGHRCSIKIVESGKGRRGKTRKTLKTDRQLCALVLPFVCAPLREVCPRPAAHTQTNTPTSPHGATQCNGDRAHPSRRGTPACNRASPPARSCTELSHSSKENLRWICDTGSLHRRCAECTSRRGWQHERVRTAIAHATAAGCGDPCLVGGGGEQRRPFRGDLGPAPGTPRPVKPADNATQSAARCVRCRQSRLLSSPVDFDRSSPSSRARTRIPLHQPSLLSFVTLASFALNSFACSITSCTAATTAAAYPLAVHHHQPSSRCSHSTTGRWLLTAASHQLQLANRHRRGRPCCCG